MERRKFGKSLFAMFMAIALVFQLASPMAAFAAVSDKDTSTKYSESLGDNASTEYAGRIWTDKSVFTNDVTFDAYGGGQITIEIDPDAQEDFLISYSALATAESISGQSQAPVDVVLILDISGSMSNSDSGMDNGMSRIYNTIQAANNAIDELMALNPYTRVAVVAFSSNAQTLLPLDRYEKLVTTENQWIQTGQFAWQGHWEEVTVVQPYFTLNQTTASSSYADLTVRAVRQSNNRAVDTTVDVEGGTNIQLGLYEGMQILATEQSTTAIINGARVQRAPSVILLSDGSPTYSSNSSSWWEPADNYNDGPGSRAYAGNGFKALLVGSYMKDAIDRNYGVAGTAYATTVYTVGMGITGLEDDERNLAYMTLDPGTYWNDTTVTNTMKTTIKNYWSSYTARNNTGTLNVNVGSVTGSVYRDKNYAVTHPNTGYDVDPTNGYDYVDTYYSADNAAAVTDVFESIVSSISIAAPQVPTEVKGSNPIEDGYITYTDPIGKYMVVKDVKSIIYAGTKFTQKSVATNGNTTTYTFSGEVHSPVYGDQNVDDIVITVEKAQNGDETLIVKIPASVIPLRVNEVTLNADGSVKTHTNNGAFPTRVIYSVGLKDGIKQVSDDGHEYLKATELTAEYLQANTNADGTVNFYSNVYTGTNEVDGYTAGNATVEFEPSHTNPFYYILEDMPIYKDAAFANQVTAAEGIDNDATYYYKDEYYHGTAVEVKAIARTGAQLTLTEIVTGSDGYLYRAAGSPRLNRILEFEGTKIDNITGTAEDFYAPTFVHAEGNPDPFEGKFVIYHGNNGVMSLPAGGNLEISKTVAAAAGLTAPGETFEFTVELDDEKINGGEYTYIIRDAEQNQVSTGTVSASNKTISLTDGQIATIYNLPPATTYAITEAAVTGFATEATGATGIIHAGQTVQAAFTNTYSVESVISDNIQGKKILAGLTSWPSNYSFTFFLSPYNNCPLPADYDADAGVTVTAADANGLEAAFEFGTIEFTAPGTYRYTVVEKEPENDGYLPGMTYSRALFRLVYEVVDNGDGTLRIDESKSSIQRLYNDEAEPLFTYGANNEIVMNAGEEGNDAISFTNTYQANSVTRVPVALKAYSDPSGTKPLLSGMFQFQLKAVGYIVDNGELQTDVSKIPMPAGSQDGVIITSNEGQDITFPHVTFTQDLLVDNGATKMTYRYELSEVIPADADKVPGMIYDDTVYTVNVVVEMDTSGADLLVSAIYPDGLRIVTFSNSYHLESVTADINGSKILNGRDMLPGETFEFSLVGANAATNNAVRDGYVIVPESTASVAGGADGEKVAFTFEDIEFTRPGTYSFLVTETAGSAPSVQYDSSRIRVTFEVADTNGDAKLEVVSTTYSNGANSADFVNTYTYRFNDTAVSLSGTKNLTGKTLMAGEFYFNIIAYQNGTKIGEGLVTHTADNTAENGVYTGTFPILNEVTYTEPGVYTYYITEQIPDDDHKVGGTTYDASEYRYTVTVIDDNEGSLKVESKKLEKAASGGWTDASAVVFNNTYVTESATANLPLIKKVITGDRKNSLQLGEFSFKMSLVSANPADGIQLPAVTEVWNDADGNVAFGHLTFTKAGIYTVKVTEVIPSDADKVPGIEYSTQEITATYRVTDDRNGKLIPSLIGFVSDPTFVNTYAPDPITYTPIAKKIYDGEEMRTFDFILTDKAGVFETQTKQNDADGNVVFDTMEFAEEGVYEFTIKEQQNILWGFIKWDTNEYTLKITVGNDSSSQLVIESVEVTSIFGRNDLVFRNAHKDIITEKTVERKSAPGIKIDGQKVEAGDILVYDISYTNYTGLPADVTVTDTIPQYTSYVAGSADNGGVYSNGVVTWELQDVPAYETVTVRFEVKVESAGGTVTNKALVLEYGNTYETNEVTNPVVEDQLDKDVFLPSADTVSIDGNKVGVGTELLYKITFTNADDEDAVVTITDTIPAHTSFVPGSADNGGVYDNGVITWNVNVAKNSQVTVSFRVITDQAGVTVTNKANATEGENSYETDPVTNPVVTDGVDKDVFYPNADTVSIDGEKVEKNDILLYKITYINSDDFDAVVTITDTIPQYTSYVAGSVDNGGVYDNGVLTWTVNVPKGESRTVSFQVKVEDVNVTVINKAYAAENGVTYETDPVTNPVVADELDKDVFLPSADTVSIDGKKVNPGDVLLYKITYTNNDAADAVVTITDTIPAHTSFLPGSADNDGVYENGVLTWTVNVEKYSSVTVSFKVTVDDATASISNKANAVEGENSYETDPVTNPVAEDALDKDVFYPTADTVSIDGEEVEKNDILLYKITYTNSDDFDAVVTITDTIPQYTSYVDGSADNGGVYDNGVITWTVNVPKGESRTVSFQVKVEDVNVTVVNKARASENGYTLETDPVTNPVVEDALDKDVFLPTADTVSIDGKKVNPGEELLYKITYFNNDAADAVVTITDTIPQYTSYVDGSADNGGVYDNGVITWTLNVAKDSVVTVSFKVVADKANVTVSNKANAVEGENSYETDPVTTTVVDDKVEKDVFYPADDTVSIDGKQVNVGDELLYKVTYYNNDAADAVVTITDIIPAHTTYVDGSADNGGAYADGKLTWTVNVAGESSVTVSFKVKVNDPDVFIENQATAIEGENEIETNVVTNHTYEEVESKDVALAEKPTVSIDGQVVQVGQILEYTIDYVNTSDAPVDVTITDEIPAHTKLHNAGTATVSENILTWTLTDVQPKETVTVTFQVKVEDPGVVIENQALIFDGSNKVTNKVTNSVPEKAVDKLTANVGDTLTYTISYTNETGAPAKLVITDKLDEALIFVEGTAGNGVYADGIITWTVENVPAGETVTVSFQAKAIAAGEIPNTAQIFENESSAVITNEVITEVLEPELSILKEQAVGKGTATTEKQTVKVGDVVTYIITVTNKGQGDAYDITVTDKIPEGLIYVGDSVNENGTVTDGVITWTLDTLEAGESLQLVFGVVVPDVEKTTVWKNVATLVDNNEPGEDTEITSNEVELEEVPEPVPEEPDTGDSFNPMFLMVVMAVSLTSLVVLLIMKKREETAE